MAKVFKIAICKSFRGKMITVSNVDAVEAISNSDAIIVGPGSLYTSILPNLAYEEIAEAVSRSNAVKIYVCNVMSVCVCM